MKAFRARPSLIGARSRCTAIGCSARYRTPSGSARQGAPSNVNFDTYTAAARAASEAVTEISAGRMPPPAETQSASDQTVALEQWAQCGTPE
jgi:hypothetical protein